MGGCLSTSNAQPTPAQQQQRQQQQQAVAADPLNRRVRAPAPWRADGPPVTLALLTARREAFWQTQSSGRAVTWEALHVVSDALLNENAELASALLEAADVRVPNGDLSVCFDSLGALYQIPRWVYSTPSNVLSEEEAASAARLTRKEHSGAVVSLQLVLRLSPSSSTTEQDVALAARSSDRVRELKERLHAKLASGECDVAPDAGAGKVNVWRDRGLEPKRQRVIFRGRELDAEQHLQEIGIEDGSVLQVFVRG